MISWPLTPDFTTPLKVFNHLDVLASALLLQINYEFLKNGFLTKKIAQKNSENWFLQNDK